MKEKEDFCVMLVSCDDYELPLASADNLQELARATKLSYSALHKSCQNGTPIRLPRLRFHCKKGQVIRVALDDDQDE